MVLSFPITLFVSTLLGFLTGLGIGGGSLLMLWLTIVMQFDPLTARNINLLFFLPAALISCFFHGKQKQIPWKKIFPAMIAGCISALLFSWLGSILQTEWIKMIFGILLIVTGFRELFYRPRKFK